MHHLLSIRVYLILLIIFILTPLIFLSLYQANRFADLQREHYYTQSRLRRDDLKNSIYQMISTDVRLLEMLAVTFSKFMDHPLSEKQDLLDHLDRRAGIFQGIYIAKPNGISEFTSPPYNEQGQKNAPKSYQERDYYHELMKTQKTALSRVQKGKTSQKPAIQMATPIMDEMNQMIAYVAANIHTEVLFKQARENIKDDPRFRVVLIDRLEQVIFDSKNMSPLFSNISHQQIFQQVKIAEKYEALDENGAMMFVSAVQIKILHYECHLFVIFPKLIIEQEANDAKQTILIYALMLMGFVFLLIYWLGSKITKITQAVVHSVQTLGDTQLSQGLAKGRDQEIDPNLNLPKQVFKEGQMMADALQKAVKRLNENIKARQIAEDQARRSDKLATIGTMVAGIAHEINNPLSYISGNLDFIEESLEEILAKNHNFQNQEFIDSIEDAKAGVARVTDIVKSLLSLSRKEQSEIVPTSVHKVVESCVRLSLGEIKKKAKVVLSIAKSTPWVYANESQLGQVILNLLVNAAQAMPSNRDPSKNIIEIKATETELAAFPNEKMLCLMVSDNGNGIPQEIIHQIFDPFFTTKPVGKGTGLGLSICMNIIQGFKGELLVESTLHEGTTFKVILHIADDQSSIKERRPTPLPKIMTPMFFEAPKAKQFKILIVDDTIEIANSLKRQLSQDYDCTVLSSAIEALDLLKVEDFDCVISDWMMPEMNGDLFFKQLISIKPKMARQLILITGGMITEELQAFLSEYQIIALQKPLKIEYVLKEIKNIQKKNYDPMI